MNVNWSETPSGPWDYEKRGLPQSTTTEPQTIHMALLIQVTQASQFLASPRPMNHVINYVYHNERKTFKTLGKPYVFNIVAECKTRQWLGNPYDRGNWKWIGTQLIWVLTNCILRIRFIIMNTIPSTGVPTLRNTPERHRSWAEPHVPTSPSRLRILLFCYLLPAQNK